MKTALYLQCPTVNPPLYPLASKWSLQSPPTHWKLDPPYVPESSALSVNQLCLSFRRRRWGSSCNRKAFLHQTQSALATLYASRSCDSLITHHLSFSGSALPFYPLRNRSPMPPLRPSSPQRANWIASKSFCCSRRRSLFLPGTASTPSPCLYLWKQNSVSSRFSVSGIVIPTY